MRARLLGADHEHRLQLGRRDGVVRLLGALGDLVADGVDEQVHEVEPLLGVRARLLRREHAVVRPLHDVLLELRRKLDELVAQLQLDRQELELGVELRDSVLREQPQQVQPEDRVLPL